MLLSYYKGGLITENNVFVFSSTDLVTQCCVRKPPATFQPRHTRKPSSTCNWQNRVHFRYSRIALERSQMWDRGKRWSGASPAPSENKHPLSLLDGNIKVCTHRNCVFLVVWVKENDTTSVTLSSPCLCYPYPAHLEVVSWYLNGHAFQIIPWNTAGCKSWPAIAKSEIMSSCIQPSPHISSLCFLNVLYFSSSQPAPRARGSTPVLVLAVYSETVIPEIQASLEVVRTWKWGEKDKRFIHGKVIQGTDIPVSVPGDRWSVLLTASAHTQPGCYLTHDGWLCRPVQPTLMT